MAGGVTLQRDSRKENTDRTDGGMEEERDGGREKTGAKQGQVQENILLRHHL